MFVTKRASWLVCLTTLATIMSACSGVSDVDGASALSGKRISVLNYGAELTPDNETLKKSISLPEPKKNAFWRQAGGNALHVMQNPYVPSKIDMAWNKSIGAGGKSRNPLIAEPVAENGVVYTIDNRGLVRAFTLENGERRWQKRVADKNAFGDVSSLGTGLALDNQMLFVALGTGEVVALNAKDGTEIWRVALSSPVRSAPSVYGGRLYVLTADNKLTALAEDDGRTLWQHYAFLESVSFFGKASPALNKGIGVAVFPSGEVLGFRPENGSILWSETMGTTRMNDAGAEINDIRARPVIAEDKVFVATTGGLLSALDLKTGNVIWEREIGSYNQPWLAGNTLYVLSTYSELVALNADDGKILWINRLARWEDEEKKEERLIWTGPVMAGSRLILTNSQGNAIAVSPQTGTIIGWDEIDSKGTLSPIVVDGVLLFLTHNGKLAAYRQ